MADSVCDAANAILSLLALKTQETGENPGSMIEEDLETLGITDEDIQALVDNELELADQRRLYDMLLFFPALQKRYEELKKQNEDLKRWWAILGGRH
jgi:hypothetical protein